MSDNSQKTKIVLTFESDWHVGTGTGIPGSTDKLIFRDSDGFPAVPAKTLNGIWRDALEILTLGLDNGDEKNKRWQKWVEFIFGNQPAEKGADPTITPFQSILSLRPARISQNLREAIGDDERLKQALTFIKAGIAIDNTSGTAEENCLRFEEMGRSGTVLDAEFNLDFSKLKIENDETKESQIKTIKALLVLSAKLVERIGGKRRRGAGKCNFAVEGLMSKDEAIEFLKETAPDVPTIDKTSDDIDLEKANDSTEWLTLEYKLTLQTPVSIVTAVLGNVSESLDFIPGTYLLPHITKNLGGKVRSAVANGDFQVSSATIEVDEKRGFPIPKVFAKEKMKQKEKDKEEIYNRLLEPLEGKNQTKPIREGYISDLSSITLSIEKTPQTLLIHNTVDDKVQRPTSEVGGVFSRQAIKAGTDLRGEIHWKKGIVKDDFNFTDLNGYVRLGTSKKDDYGLADFEVFEKETVGKDERKFEKQLIVYLASDVLLRNDNLRQTNLIGDLAKELSGKLGVDLTEVKPEKGLISSIIQVRRIESWQVGWGFPRPTLTAMSAGSVVVFKSDKDLILVDLKKIEANGIGERRGEGYGQIIFNPPLLMNSVKVSDEKKEKEVKKGDISKLKNLKEELEFAKQIEITAWREELKVAVLKIAAEKDLREQIFGFEIKKENNDEKKSVPPMSQIGGLRSAISRLQSNSVIDKKIVTDWLEHLKQTSNRFEKWGENRIDKFRRLETLINQDAKIWLTLFKSRNQSGKRVWKSIPKFVRQKKEIREELWAEAVRALFYACQHAHKRDLEKPEQKKEAANG